MRNLFFSNKQQYCGLLLAECGTESHGFNIFRGREMDQYDIIKKLERVGTNILETSRSEIYMYMRFLAMAFAGFKYAPSSKTGGIGTDGYYIYYSPMFLIEKYRIDLKWVNRAYLHMIFHCIFRHPSSRAPARAAARPTSTATTAKSVRPSIPRPKS